MKAIRSDPKLRNRIEFPNNSLQQFLRRNNSGSHAPQDGLAQGRYSSASSHKQMPSIPSAIEVTIDNELRSARGPGRVLAVARHPDSSQHEDAVPDQ